jgi:hypothetical protein
MTSMDLHLSEETVAETPPLHPPQLLVIARFGLTAVVVLMASGAALLGVRVLRAGHQIEQDRRVAVEARIGAVEASVETERGFVRGRVAAEHVAQDRADIDVQVHNLEGVARGTRHDAEAAREAVRRSVAARNRAEAANHRVAEQFEVAQGLDALPDPH